MDMDEAVLVMDSGAHSIKALWCAFDATDDSISTYRNAIASSKTEKRNYTGNEINSCPDFGGLVFKLPCDKGILNNWDTQRTVWDHVFSRKGMEIDTATTQLFITEPVMNLPNVQESYDQMLFEEYDFLRYLRAPGPAVVPYGTASVGMGEFAPDCVLVIDSGFSFTQIVPVIRGQIIASGVRRIDVGGKLLTNYLKELISFRQWYMMDQTSVIEKVKEDCCYVSQEWGIDWEIANQSVGNTIVQTYVLPDFQPTSKNKLGYIRPPPTGFTPAPTPIPIDEDEDFEIKVDLKGKGKAKELPIEEEQLLHMSNERFAIPEVIFHPSTIGLDQAGLSESIAHSIQSLPEEIRGMFWSNIVCVGGNVGFNGFVERLRTELRSFAPEEYEVNIRRDPSPINSIALSASTALLANPLLAKNFVSRVEYLESGSNATTRKCFGQIYLNTEAQVLNEIGKLS